MTAIIIAIILHHPYRLPLSSFYIKPISTASFSSISILVRKWMGTITVPICRVSSLLIVWSVKCEVWGVLDRDRDTVDRDTVDRDTVDRDIVDRDRYLPSGRHRTSVEFVTTMLPSWSTQWNCPRMNRPSRTVKRTRLCSNCRILPSKSLIIPPLVLLPLAEVTDSLWVDDMLGMMNAILLVYDEWMQCAENAKQRLLWLLSL